MRIRSGSKTTTLPVAGAVLDHGQVRAQQIDVRLAHHHHEPLPVRRAVRLTKCAACAARGRPRAGERRDRARPAHERRHRQSPCLAGCSPSSSSTTASRSPASFTTPAAVRLVPGSRVDRPHRPCFGRSGRPLGKPRSAAAARRPIALASAPERSWKGSEPPHQEFRDRELWNRIQTDVSQTRGAAPPHSYG